MPSHSTLLAIKFSRRPLPGVCCCFHGCSTEGYLRWLCGDRGLSPLPSRRHLSSFSVARSPTFGRLSSATRFWLPPMGSCWSRVSVLCELSIGRCVPRVQSYRRLRGFRSFSASLSRAGDHPPDDVCSGIRRIDPDCPGFSSIPPTSASTLLGSSVSACSNNPKAFTTPLLSVINRGSLRIAQPRMVKSIASGFPWCALFSASALTSSEPNALALLANGSQKCVSEHPTEH